MNSSRVVIESLFEAIESEVTLGRGEVGVSGELHECEIISITGDKGVGFPEREVFDTRRLNDTAFIFGEGFVDLSEESFSLPSAELDNGER